MSNTTPGPKPPVSPIGPPKSVGGNDSGPPASPGQSFENFMKPKGAGSPGQVQGAASPFALAQGQALATTPTFDTLVSQTVAAQTALGGVQTQLTTPNLKLKASQKYLLRNKLSEADAHLRSANAKMGVEPGPEPQLPAGSGPIQKFLAFVNDGQAQIDSAKEQLNKMKERGESLSPGDMMLIQIKINKAQQEIEFSAMLLSKAVDDIKTLMNVQI
jgi:hypothetical protein